MPSDVVEIPAALQTGVDHASSRGGGEAAQLDAGGQQPAVAGETVPALMVRQPDFGRDPAGQRPVGNHPMTGAAHIPPPVAADQHPGGFFFSSRFGRNASHQGREIQPGKLTVVVEIEPVGARVQGIPLGEIQGQRSPGSPGTSN